MKKQSLFLISLLSFVLLFTSCGEEKINIEIGKEFKIAENPITILKLEETKVLRKTKEETVLTAPKGKKYIYFEVKNPKNEMIFLKAYNKEKELESEDDLYGYTHDVDGGFTDAYYLVDENSTIDKIVITTPSETQYTVLNPVVSKSKMAISEEAQKIVDAYSEEKEIGQLEGFAPFVKDGKSVFDIAKQEGQILASNVLSKKAEVTYFTEDGKKYVFTVTNIFKSSGKITTYWENGKITSIEVVEN